MNPDSQQVKHSQPPAREASTKAFVLVASAYKKKCTVLKNLGSYNLNTRHPKYRFLQKLDFWVAVTQIAVVSQTRLNTGQFGNHTYFYQFNNGQDYIIIFLHYYKYYSQVIVVFLVSNRQVDIELLNGYYAIFALID